MVCDLRSDTLTKPSLDMLRHAAASDQGDDCFGEAKAVTALEERCADLFGKEAALLLPTGTMSNQIALRVIARPGDEVICDASYHINFFEAAQSSAFSGVSLNSVGSADGVLRKDLLDEAVSTRARWTDTYAKTTAVWLENTINGKNGRPLSLAEMQDINRWARDHGLFVYIDGARVLNAAAALNLQPAEIGAQADGISMCFAKGLGAPMGSILAGSRQFIGAARRYRKWFGGSLHQSGFIASAAHYALDHNQKQIVQDHRNARTFSEKITNMSQISVDQPETNIVMFDVGETGLHPSYLVSELHAKGVRILVWKDTTLRAVFSSLVDEEMSKHAAEVVLDTIRLMQNRECKAYA